MPKYQLAVTEVESLQFTGDNANEVMAFMEGHHAAEGTSFVMGDRVYLSSNQGMHTGGIGVYVLKTASKDVFLCPAYTFQNLFEQVY